MLVMGSTGRAVGFLQSRLGLAISGTFGPYTDTALRAWQAAAGLKPDGVYGPMSNQRMVARAAGDVEAAAQYGSIDAQAFAAVVSVESVGSGFHDDGRAKILLERHYVYRLATQAQRDKLTADLCYPTAGGYKGGLAEWDRFEAVAAISLDLAIQSCSWGLGQVMGANFAALDYLNPTAFLHDAVFNEARQLVQMAEFIVSKPGLKFALNAHDWVSAARLYNGPNYAAQGYHLKLAAAFKAA